MIGCTKADTVQKRISVEEMVELRLAEFREGFEHKMKELDEVFKSVGDRQSKIESLSRTEHNQVRTIIEGSYNALQEHLENVSKNTVRDFEVRFEVREKLFDTEIKTFSQKLNGIENLLMKEKERLDQLQQMSGMTMIDVEKKLQSNDEDVEQKIDALTEQLEDLKMTMESVHEKMYEHESCKKNNLIFYGIPREEKETSKTLLMKVKSIISNKLNIKRSINMLSISRMFNGPEINNCQPIVVTFEEFQDKDEVLKIAKLRKYSGFSITEDLSKKTREARQQLRKFMREMKRNSPEKRCFMEQDKLFVDGRVFIYNETEGRVVEQKDGRRRSLNKNDKRQLMIEYEEAQRPEEKQLPDRVRQLEKMIREQMKVIKGQQITIQNQKNIIENQKTDSPGFDDSLEDLIDREENCFDSEDEED